ncbi:MULTISPECIES: polysaccharide deacetylase family protein [unclassified Clostridium]|uniref:polysaccharide deacetylase family protein n=1 Tax=unclassified Clostridium TaxID=2614128 RepID=UPI0002973EAB|nr:MULTISPECIES: polysaccharide deacetylase family protein [unclassified Clostridium]EKQ58321.1 MAG: putative xylanase/chitin deacetylase [Clostridium sp. Maddingley MBC34-26]
MKKNFRYILFLAMSVFLIIFIFEENMSCTAMGADKVSNEEIMENEKISKDNKKVIYLTFDDGPSYKVTNKILDILKENNVNATFFLIGNQIEGREDVVRRIYEEGNSIGLHSCTHNFKRIYSDEDKFIQEMMICRSQIYETIGIAPNIIRFPGGSCRHLSKSYLRKLHANNFKVYDWDLDNNDGINPKIPPYQLYKKAITGSEDKDKIILLMHCTDMNKNTCKALPQIIKYYKSHGFEFKVITEETTELYFPIKK